MSADSWNITADPSAGVWMVPAVGLVEPGDEVQQRRLAAARRAEQADELAGGDVEDDVVEHERPAPKRLETCSMRTAGSTAPARRPRPA